MGKVQQTSIDAYYNFVECGQLNRLQKLVYDYVLAHPFCSQSECASCLKLEKVSVNPRFAELYNKGVIDYGEKRVCEVTGREVMTWRCIAQRQINVMRCPHCYQVMKKCEVSEIG